MKRGIIVAMEEYEGTDPNDLDFSDFEPVMGNEGNEIISEMDSVIDATIGVETHMNITDIITTEGLGNRPQIAAIALSALETKLFGKPVTVPRVGTESRTRIAAEGKNIFLRVWDAISKFFKRLWERIQSVFGGGKKEKIKNKAKQVKEADVKEATQVMEVVSHNTTAKEAVASPEPISSEKIETIVKEVKEKVKAKVKKEPKPAETEPENKQDEGSKKLDEIDELVKANIKATKMLSENVNLFASGDCQGPKNIIEGMDEAMKFFDQRNENEILESLDKRIEELIEIGKKENGFKEYLSPETRDKSLRSWYSEIKTQDKVINTILVPGYAIESTMFKRWNLKQDDLTRLTKSYIRLKKPDFYQHYLYILENKDLISKKIEDIADLTDRVKSLNDAIKKHSDKIDILKKSIDVIEDSEIGGVGDMIIKEFKEILGTLRLRATVANAYIAFADAIHNCIVKLDKKKDKKEKKDKK